MIVIDSSAIVAILLDEPERAAFRRTIADADGARMSAASLVETTMVIEGRLGDEGASELDTFLLHADIEIAPVDERRAKFARTAWRRYGKGRHPAGLKFGDCFAYAEAAIDGSPLLFKGDDFGKTDLIAAA